MPDSDKGKKETGRVISSYQKSAIKHLKRCDVLLAECTAMVDALEEKLANTPKPSEILDW